ncbi:MAG: hypothetical protein ABI347_02775 [Nitrososphaera sp.]
MKSVIIAALAIAALLGTTILSATSTVLATPSGNNNSSDANKLVAQLRQVTAKYHNSENAIADGYQPTDTCVPQMGYHYVNIKLAADLSATELQPEVVVYAPTANGLKLVAVEYFVVALANTPNGPAPWFGATPPPPGFYNPAPSLFDGQTFDGPMAGHEPGMPWHYDLHAWVWKHNPDGLFTAFNPTVTCGN